MRKPKIFIALLRIALGWIFFYQGIVAVMTKGWSLLSVIDLKGALTFHAFYVSLSNAPALTYASTTLEVLFIGIGALLILGVGARIGSLLGIIVMLFLYFPLLHFPRVGTSYFIVDEHIVYALILAYLFTAKSGDYFVLGSLFKLSRY